MRTAAIVAVLFLCLACDSFDDFGPTEPVPIPPIPDIVGTYTSAEFLEITVFTAWHTQTKVTCPGRLVVADQAGHDWSGSWILEPAPGCSAGSFLINNGTVTPAGLIAFTGELMEELELGDSFGDGLLPGSGCTVVESSSRFSGSVAGSSMNADGHATYDCGLGEEMNPRITFSMQGTRS